TREGVPTSRGHQRTLSAAVWHPATVTSILHNTAYIGRLYEGKTQRLPSEKDARKKTRIRRMPRETWIPIDVPAIIEHEVFEAAQAQLQRNKLRAKRNRKYEYLLVGGRLRCGQCGSAMSPGNKYGVSYYLCGRKVFHDVVAEHTRRSIKAQQ